MENLPFYIPAVFIAATMLTLYFLYKASHHSKIVLLISLAWLSLQAVIGLSEFYAVTNALPPRLLLNVLPPLLFISLCFSTKRGIKFLKNFDVKWLTALHVVRIPAEMVLFWLSIQKLVPDLMTFEGRNFDILSGLTAPFIFYFGYIRKTLNSKVLLGWNFICLALLFNIVM
ncbi:MAG: hypothetical protein ACXWDO_13260, partial [Bacteroidia bacterium]